MRDEYVDKLVKSPSVDLLDILYLSMVSTLSVELHKVFIQTRLSNVILYFTLFLIKNYFGSAPKNIKNILLEYCLLFTWTETCDCATLPARL